jgi:hypothetical protein
MAALKDRRRWPSRAITDCRVPISQIGIECQGGKKICLVPGQLNREGEPLEEVDRGSHRCGR